MLFPNTRVRMRTMDKLLIGVPALVSGGIVVTTKLGTTLVLIGSLIGYWIGIHQEPVELNRATVIALLAGLGALGAYLWKQTSNFRNRKLRFMQALDVPHDKINVNGGAIAMGHPLGATGAMITGVVVDELERSGKESALVTLCIGAGMGTAAVIERV